MDKTELETAVVEAKRRLPNARTVKIALASALVGAVLVAVTSRKAPKSLTVVNLDAEPNLDTTVD